MQNQDIYMIDKKYQNPLMAKSCVSEKKGNTEAEEILERASLNKTGLEERTRVPGIKALNLTFYLTTCPMSTSFQDL